MDFKNLDSDLMDEIKAIQSSLSYGRKLEAFWKVLGVKMLFDIIGRTSGFEDIKYRIDQYYKETSPSFKESKINKDCDHLQRIFAIGGDLLSEEYALVLSLMIDMAQAEIYQDLKATTLANVHDIRNEFQEFLSEKNHKTGIQKSEVLFRKNNFKLRQIDSLSDFVTMPLSYMNRLKGNTHQ